MTQSQAERILLLFNPAAGRGSRHRLQKKLRRALRECDLEASTQLLATEPDTLAQCRTIEQHFGTVLIAGGDGTISQVAAAFSARTQAPRLGIIPIGTGNDLAIALGLRTCYQRAGISGILKCVRRGRSTAIDLLRINGQRIATNYIGLGNDALIATAFDILRRKPLIRHLCGSVLRKAVYGLLAGVYGMYRVPCNVDLRYRTADGHDAQLHLPAGFHGLVISTNATYAGGAILSSRARMHDAVFEITVFQNTWQWLNLGRAIFGRAALDTLHPAPVSLQARWAELHISGRTYCQIDGEPAPWLCGAADNVITIAPCGKVSFHTP